MAEDCEPGRRPFPGQDGNSESMGGGRIAFHPASSPDAGLTDAETNGAGKSDGKEGGEEEGEGKAKEAEEEAAANVSNVRKMLLNPAEEALESARQAAEVIVKDAMDTLQRTKQRIREIFPHSAASSSAANDAAGQGSEAANSRARSSGSGAQVENPANERLAEDVSSIATVNVATEPVLGFFRPFRRRLAAAEMPIQSRL